VGKIISWEVCIFQEHNFTPPSSGTSQTIWSAPDAIDCDASSLADAKTITIASAAGAQFRPNRFIGESAANSADGTSRRRMLHLFLQESLLLCQVYWRLVS
jgi:hypothetical protein